MLGWVLRAITAASAVALFLPAPANALTATGVAVGFVGSSVEVGLTENRPLLGNQEAIEYFIPLKDNNGTYGVGSNKCGGTGFGTCADSGDGGGLLTMILRFTPVSTTEPSTLEVLFEDLDLKNANDPVGFLERLQVVRANNTPVTPWITDINQILSNGTLSGDADTQQLLSVALGVLSNDPLYLKLVFKSKSDFHGTNTAEYLIATVSSPDPVPDQVVPLPAGVVLMGSVLFGACGITSWRRRRRAAA